MKRVLLVSSASSVAVPGIAELFRLPRDVAICVLEWLTVDDFAHMHRVSSRCSLLVEDYFRRGTQLYFRRNVSLTPFLKRMVAFCHNNIRILRCVDSSSSSWHYFDSDFASVVRANAASLRVIDGATLGRSLFEPLALCSRLEALGPFSDIENATDTEIQSLLRAVEQSSSCLTQLDFGCDEKKRMVPALGALNRHACVTKLGIDVPVELVRDLARLPLQTLHLGVDKRRVEYNTEDTLNLWNTLGSISTLTELYLTVSGYSDLPPPDEPLTFPCLRHFEFSAVVADIAVVAPKLKSLDASILPAKWFFVLTHCPSLETVRFRDYRLDEDDAIPVEVENDDAKVVLACSVPPIADLSFDDGVPWWAWPLLMRMTSLTRLQLCHYELFGRVLRHTLNHLSSLTSLILRNSKYNNADYNAEFDPMPDYIGVLLCDSSKEKKLPTTEAILLPSLRRLVIQMDISFLEPFDAPMLQAIEIDGSFHTMRSSRLVRRLVCTVPRLTFSALDGWFEDEEGEEGKRERKAEEEEETMTTIVDTNEENKKHNKEEEDVKGHTHKPSLVLSATSIHVVRGSLAAIVRMFKSCVRVTIVRISWCEVASLKELFACMPPTVEILEISLVLGTVVNDRGGNNGGSNGATGGERDDISNNSICEKSRVVGPKQIFVDDAIALLTRCPVLHSLTIQRNVCRDTAWVTKVEAYLKAMHRRLNLIIR